MEVRLTVLGSGTSMGVPTIGCDCKTCTSPDPHDNRLRPSIVLQYSGRTVLIDTTPDFRQQALRARIRRIDAILFTHSHADHIMGLDDVRPINLKQGSAIPVYGSPETLAGVRNAFRYIFELANPESTIPKLALTPIEGEPFDLFGLRIQPILLQHGRSQVTGFRFGPAAYLTDHSDIPNESLALLGGLEVLFLDALRYKPHPTHSTVARSLEYVELLRPTRAYFTHIGHDLMHERANQQLPPHVRLAYDGLEIDLNVEDAAN